jgi:hypothetical protein
MGARARKSVKKEILEIMQIAGTDRKLSAKKAACGQFGSFYLH